MTPADLITQLQADVATYSEAELADAAHFFSLLYGQRFVEGPADAARALLSGLPQALAVLSPAERQSAKDTLLAALEALDAE